MLQNPENYAFRLSANNIYQERTSQNMQASRTGEIKNLGTQH